MRTRRLSKVTIVAGDSPREEDVLNFRAAADVMNHHVIAGLFRPNVRDDADVVITIRVPSHDITGQVILMVLSHRQRLAFALEEGLENGNAPVVYIRVRLLQAPLRRVSGEVPQHILV